MPKIQYIILYHIKAISVNKYFDLIIYINNILEILMTLLLYSNNIDDTIIKNSIKVKNEIINFLNDLMKNSKFNKYIPDLIYSLSHFIIPKDKTYSSLLKSLSVIKCINSFSNEYSINYIYPNITSLLIYINQPIIFKYKEKIVFVENKPLQQIQNQNSVNQSIQNSLSQSSIPIKTFTIPFSNDFLIPMSVSNIAGESLIQGFGQNNIDNINEKVFFRISENKEDENLCKENLISFYYEAIFRTIEIAVNWMKERKVPGEQIEQCKNELNQIFGENLVKLFFNNINKI